MINYATSFQIEDEVIKTEEYPYGKALDADPRTKKIGFPLKAAFVNDLLGAFQALLVAAGIEPSGQEEDVKESDVLKALKKLIHTPMEAQIAQEKKITETQISHLKELITTQTAQIKKLAEKQRLPAGTILFFTKEEGVDPEEALGAGWEDVTDEPAFAFAETAGLTAWQKQPEFKPPAW